MAVPRPLRPAGATVVVLEADPARRAGLRSALARMGHRARSASTAASALRLVAGAPRLVVVGAAPRDMSLEVFRAGVAARAPLVQIVLAPHPSARSERLRHTIDLALAAHDHLATVHAAARLERELLASASHELRTPLNVIVGYLDLLHEGDFGRCPPEALPVLEKIRANATYLLDLVGEFLDLARQEAAGEGGPQQRVALAPLLRELAESFTLLVRTKPVEFQLDLPAELPALAGEAAKLRIVVQNLLSNAEKFTREGFIRLTARRLPGRRVAVAVTDSGPGIAPEHHEAVFGLFHQLETPPGRGGVGLGLALARRFARHMGGDITLESAPGRGSTFTLVLPAASAGSSPATDDAA